MSLIKNPNELSFSGVWAGLIYGEPGAGKSTLALSAPTPVMIDADNGMRRVQKRFQAPSLPMTSYQQFLDLVDTKELDSFETFVFDTLGKFVDLIGDWVQVQDPKNRKKGGGLSQQGYGSIKLEFARIIRLLKSRGKYLLFVAHGREEKDGEVTKIRPDVVGASGKDLVKDLDWMGYVEMLGDRRTISFNPNERYYAKNALDLPPYIEIPDPNKVGNTFVQKFIIERQEARAKEDEIENAKYDTLIAALKSNIDSVTDAASAQLASEVLRGTEHKWDSLIVARHLFAEKTKALGLTWDKEKKVFVKAEADKTEEAKTEPEKTESAKEEPAKTEPAKEEPKAESVAKVEDAFEAAKQKKIRELKKQVSTK